MSFADQIRQEIKSQEIKPIPKWVFLTKSILFGICFCLALILGGLAVSLILYYIFEGGFEDQRSPIMGFIKSLPFFWIISFGLFSAFALWGMKHLPKGYKISIPLFIGGNLFLSFLLGAGLYALDFPEKIENKISNIPFHAPLEKRIEKQWNEPQNGYLGGIILEVDLPKKQLELEDFNGKKWKILIDDKLAGAIRKKVQPIIQKSIGIKGSPPPKFEILINKKVKIRGEKIDNDVFEAHQIQPWKQNRFKPCRGPECEKLIN